MRYLSSISLGVVVLMALACSPTASESNTLEDQYTATVTPIMHSYGLRLAAHQTRLEAIGKDAKGARNDAMYWQSVEELIVLIEGTVSAMQADLDAFNSILPPAKFHDFHALYLIGMNDQVQSQQTLNKGKKRGWTGYNRTLECGPIEASRPSLTKGNCPRVTPHLGVRPY